MNAHDSNQFDAHGCWLRPDPAQVRGDYPLADALREFVGNHTVIDFGCGSGANVDTIGPNARGYDGNPHTPLLAGDRCEVLDLAVPVHVEPADWVLSLEVGEHIPAEFEDAFIGNLHTHNRLGVVISWAVPGQGGCGHVNCRDNAHVRGIFHELGYTSDYGAQKQLRDAASMTWFKNTLLVFRRDPPG